MITKLNCTVKKDTEKKNHSLFTLSLNGNQIKAVISLL